MGDKPAIDHTEAQPLTKQEWVKRELAKMPPRSEAWRAETRRLWGFKSLGPDNLDAGGIEPSTPAGLVDDDSADIAA
jgi:hypothetical protein